MFGRKRRKLPDVPWHEGMTRDQIVRELRAVNASYQIDVVFNDDDTIRTINGYLKDGHHRPWRATNGVS